MLDLIISGGTIVDGSGGAPFTADVGIAGGTIVALGRVDEPARETIKADGALVTPGFIDLHSHFDGQFTWDNKLDPSFSHGVTTVLGGNCGVGFAPVIAEHRAPLMDMMDGVEDIPEIVLAEGLRWDWESFPDYLDRLDERSYSMDIGVHMTHAPLRVYVMGERALRHEAATADDISRMCELVREGMAAGALGFSAARLVEHRARSGGHVPGTFAEQDELAALARAMGAAGSGVFQIVPWGAVGNNSMDARREEHDLIEELCLQAGRPLTYLLQQSRSDPDDWRQFHQWSRDAQRRGVPVFPQFSARGVGLLTSLDGPHLFQMRPSYKAIANLPLRERLAAMRSADLRGRILSEEDEGDLTLQGGLGTLRAGKEWLYAVTDDPDYEPTADQRFGVLAAASGLDIDAYIYDHLVGGEAGGCAVFYALNYSNGNLDHVRELLDSEATLAGLGDAGAHCRMICDASLPTFSLTHWTRDRQRGPRLPIEKIVRKLTGQPADFYGFGNRGRLATGMRADINVIDYDNLRLLQPRTHHDLPAGGARVLQGSSGYLATLVNGTITRRDDQDSGARPGRLLRAGKELRSSPAKERHHA